MTTVNKLSERANNELAALIQKSLGDVFPALAIYVIWDETVLLNQAWGWIDPDREPETERTPVTLDTLFDLASVTKLFTSTAFLSQVSEGKVSLKTPVVDVIPEFGTASPREIGGGQDPHTKAVLPVPDDLRGGMIDPTTITFFHLLTHTSGLPPWRDVYNIAPPPSPPQERDEISRDERWSRAVKQMCAYPFVGYADATVRYSDVGLMLLGEAASRLDGQKLDEVIQARVVAPASLGEVVFNPVREHNVSLERIAPTENDPLWRQRRAWGEVHDENACGVGGVAGHAGLFANAESVARLGHAWLKQPEVFGIDAELADAALTEQAATDNERRGLGWMLKSVEDSSAGELFDIQSYGHTGFTGTSLWIDPTRQLVVACLTNRVYPGRDKPGIHLFRRALHDLIVQHTSK